MSKPIETSYIRDEVEVVARNQIENLQLERLRAGIWRLSTTVPFYRKSLSEAGLLPTAFVPWMI